MKNKQKIKNILKLVFGISLFVSIAFSCSSDDDGAPIPVQVVDQDSDGIPDAGDNCPEVDNPDQADIDNNGIGDACQDTDNDGILDIVDNCIDRANPDQADLNNNGIGDICETATAVSPCIDGMAGEFPCNGFDLMGSVSVANLGGEGIGNDSWGWTDPDSGREYALVCMASGAAFVDITNTNQLQVLGFLPTATVNSSWRDIKVYNNYAFIVSEAAGHGIQVFDLTRLRNVTNAPETFTADANYTGFGKAHNIVINEASGYAYGVGTDTFTGGPHFVNIQNPLSPIAEGGYAEGGYSHDAQVVTYNGPDLDYTGKEILIGSNGTKIAIVDITDKANPIEISTITYNNVGYVHQGWFTEDMKHFILGDETDEIRFGGNTRAIVFDFTDLDNPAVKMEYFGTTTATDHNGYVVGDTYYQANYRAGMRAIDITNIESNVMIETGFFDTFPASDNAGTNGTWNVYPFFSSGNIIISDMNKGLFIVKKNNL